MSNMTTGVTAGVSGSTDNGFFSFLSDLTQGAQGVLGVVNGIRHPPPVGTGNLNYTGNSQNQQTYNGPAINTATGSAGGFTKYLPWIIGGAVAIGAIWYLSKK